jgi:hypothetical protein
MAPATAKAQCRLQIGERCLDGALSGSRSLILFVAFVAVLALLIALLPLVYATAQWLGQNTTAKPAAAPMVQISTPRVPARAVEGLERIDLSVVVRNPGDQTLENVTLELAVLQPDGSIAMASRQGSLTLRPQESRAVYWAWRVPAQLATGKYDVAARAYDGSGQPLDGNQPAVAGLQVVGRAR